jgi:hypothetical protein
MRSAARRAGAAHLRAMSIVTIDELTLADDPSSWAALGFTVDGGVCRIGSVELRLSGQADRRGLLGWSLRAVRSTELDGLATTLSTRPLPDAAPAHDNGVFAIDHVVAVSPDLDRSVAVLQLAGLELRRVREQPTPAGAPRQAFFRLGAEILELVQEPEEVIERHGGRERPAVLWGLALLSEDLERTAEQLAPHVGEVRDAVQPGRRIATVRRSAGVGVPLALMSPAGHANAIGGRQR